MGLIDRTIGLLHVYPSLLTEEGRLVLQHAVTEPLQMNTDKAFELVDARRYGATILSFLGCIEN